VFGIIMFSLLSCGRKPSLTITRPAKSHKQVFTELVERESGLRSVAQSVDIELTTPDMGSRSLDGTVYYNEGDYSVKLEGTLGKDVARILVKNDTIYAYSPPQNTYYIENRDEMIPDWNIRVVDILDMMTGPYGFDSRHVRYLGEDGSSFLFRIADDRTFKRIAVRRETVNITDITILSIDPESKVDCAAVRFSDFHRVDGVYRPRHIIMEIEKESIIIKMRIKSEKLNQDLPRSFFEIDIPEKALRVESGWFWENL
jgi:outer membrane lipoprotein-sorting protein